MKKVYNIICCGITFLMFLSLMLSIILSCIQLCFTTFYTNNVFFIKPLTLIICFLLATFIMVKYYNFSTHHIFYRN